MRDFRVTVAEADPTLLSEAQTGHHVLATTLTQHQKGPRDDLAKLGAALFRLAFPTPEKERELTDALADAEAGDQGLRVWLRVTEPELASLPWEYLRLTDEALAALPKREYREEGWQGFLALHRRVSLVRQPLEKPPSGAIERIGALRLLVAWADPGSGGWPRLGQTLQSQVNGILNGLRGLPRSHIEVKVLAGATRGALEEKMRGWKPHILHFTGHGGVPGLDKNIYDLEAPSLVLQAQGDGANGHAYLAGDELRAWCADAGTQVVVLNCCWGAWTSPKNRRIRGLADALTTAPEGTPVPVVVAMQFEIPASAALGFALSFYGDLAATLPLEDAVANYRRDTAAGAFGASAPEWGIPVVHQAVASTALFRAERVDPYPVNFRTLLLQHVPIVGREFVAQVFERFQKRQKSGVFLLTAPPGVGKTAFLSQWVLDHQDTVHFFYRATAGVTDPDECVKSVYQALLGKYGVVEENPSTEPREVRRKLWGFLETVSQKCRALGRPEVILVDALDEAGLAGSDKSAADEVFPETLPEGVYVLASARPGPLADRLRRRRGVLRFRLQPGSRRNLADALVYCANSLRGRLDGATEEETLGLADTLAHRAQGNFLVLKMFLDPRALGAKVTASQVEQAAEHLTGAVEQAYADFLERVRRHLSLGDRKILDRTLGAFATAQGPVTEEQLRTAFGLDPSEIDWAFERVAQFLERGGIRGEEQGALTYRLWHQTFQEYWLAKLGSSAREEHGRWAEWCGKWAKLAGYDRFYALRHLPTHLREAANQAAEKDPRWASLADTLCDLAFVEAKCAAGMTYELLADYGAALKVLPEAQPERQRKERLARWSQDLIACAREELLRENLEVIPSVVPWTEAQIQADTERVLTNPTRLDRVRAFAQFAAAESHDLVKFAGRPGYLVQQAHNSARNGPVPSAAEALLPRTDAALLLVPAPWRPQPNPHPPLLQTLEGHTGPVTSVALTPDGRRAVSASDDGTLRVWDLETGASRALEEHFWFRITSVALTPDGRRAVLGSWDHTLRVWDLETGASRALVGYIHPVMSIALTPDGRRAVSGGGFTLGVWDLETGASRALEEHFWFRITSVAVTPDGRRAVSGDEGHTLLVWDLEKGASRALKGHTGPVTSVALTPDGRRAVSASSDKTLRVWDLETGASRALEGHTGTVTSVALTPDGRRAVSGSSDKTLRVWDLKDRFVEVIRAGRDKTLPVWTLKTGASRALKGHTDWVTSVALTPDGRRAVSASSDKTLRVWDLETGASPALEGHTGTVTSVALTPDGRRAVSASHDGTLRVWDLDTGASRALVGHTSAVKSVALTPDGRRAVSGGRDETLRVWDLETGASRALEGHTGPVTSVALTPDGGRAVSGWGGSLRVWDLETGVWRALKGHILGVTSVALTPDGRRAVSGSEDHTLRVWDLETRASRALKGHTGKVTSVALTPDGRRAVSASHDQTLRVWDLETEASRALEEHTGLVTSVALSPDGRWAVSRSSYTLRVWDLETGASRALTGHTNGVASVALTPDGRRAVSGSYDKTLRVWDLETGACVALVPAESPIAAVSAAELEKGLAFGTTSGQVFFAVAVNLPP